jgi:hypothetical protein
MILRCILTDVTLNKKKIVNLVFIIPYVTLVKNIILAKPYMFFSLPVINETRYTSCLQLISHTQEPCLL